MSSYRSYIQKTADYISDLTVPVFVRYGAEMNITEGMENHSQYVDDGITPRNSYALYTNDAMANKYNALVADDSYLSDISGSTSTRFAEVGSSRDVSVRAAGSTLNMKIYSIVGGYEDGTLRPDASMTRGEVAKVLYSTFFQ